MDPEDPPTIDMFPLSEEEKNMIIRLPFRVGMWVSTSDQVGGEQSDEIERNTLYQMLFAYREDFCKSEFVEDLLSRTVAKSEYWPKWEQSLKTVPKECRIAVMLMRDNGVDEKSITSYTRALVDFAEGVAMAFNESEQAGAPNLLGKILKNLGSLFGGEDNSGYHSSISAAERRALKTLNKALLIEQRA